MISFKGSSDLFLPGATCGATCQGHIIYDTSASSTAQDQSRDFSLLFGDGSSIQGEVFSDTVTLGGLTVIISCQYSCESGSNFVLPPSR